MGNKKNNENKQYNSHRHVYVRKRYAYQTTVGLCIMADRKKTDNNGIQCRKHSKDEGIHKKGKPVKKLLYSTFRGKEATSCGSLKEPETLQQYLTHQHGKVEACGLFVTISNPWLAASPDGCVLDPSDLLVC